MFLFTTKKMNYYPHSRWNTVNIYLNKELWVDNIQSFQWSVSATHWVDRWHRWDQTSFHTIVLTFKIMGDSSRSPTALLQGCLATRELHGFSSHSFLVLFDMNRMFTLSHLRMYKDTHSVWNTAMHSAQKDVIHTICSILCIGSVHCCGPQLKKTSDRKKRVD